MKVKKATDEKREAIQKMEWSEKFWKDKHLAMEKECQTLRQKCDAGQETVTKLKDQYNQAQIEYFAI